MGYRKDAYMFRDLGFRAYCWAWSVAWGVSEWVRLLGRLVFRDVEKRREERFKAVPLGE